MSQDIMAASAEIFKNTKMKIESREFIVDLLTIFKIREAVEKMPDDEDQIETK